jgi:YVTN family beta-propeller protein
MKSNASLTYFVPDSNRVYQDVFRAVNGRSLGDVGNDMKIFQGRGYIVVNNSSKVEVIDINTDVSVGTISVGAGKSPRQIEFVDANKAYLTNLYDSSAAVLNLSTFEVTKYIRVGQNPEGIAITQGKAYVANSGFGAGNTVSVINTATDNVFKTIRVGDNPSYVTIDSDGEIYVLCTGQFGDYSVPGSGTPAKLFILNPQNDTVTDSILIGGHPFKIGMSSVGFAFVPTDTAVVRIDTRLNRSQGAFLSGRSFYSVGVDDVSGDLYLGDAKDFVQSGEVMIYTAVGTPKGKFQAGIIPGTIVFRR